jgi:citrate/tricarballylate utilization protein
MPADSPATPIAAPGPASGFTRTRLDPALPEMAHAAHVMTVCNACRYCEQYCPVFPAMEARGSFGSTDLAYLANLCHNCGECLYACQFAPPHEFGINVPQVLAQVRLRTYEAYCWPPALGAAFRQNGVGTALALTTLFAAVLTAAIRVANPDGLSAPAGDFYAVMPHGVMVTLFGGVSLFVLLALAIGLRAFWRDVPQSRVPSMPAIGRALRDALTLRHLHGAGADCTTAEETRPPWRRWCHHCTLYGFLLCFASTTVAAVYHVVFGWHAPHAYLSLPVVLGTAGGLGLLVGPAGLLVVRRRRDSALADADQDGLDESFILLLWLTSLTGLILLVLRDRAVMGYLLAIHLGAVLALFVTLPYGKFVHGLYRTAALVVYAAEQELSSAELKL